MKTKTLFFSQALSFMFILLIANCMSAQSNNSRKSVGNTTVSASKQSTTTVDKAPPTAPQEYTGFWFSMCGNELIQMGRGSVPAKVVKLTSKNEIASVDMTAFKRAVKHQTQSSCKNNVKPGQEFFIIQLKKDAQIANDNGSGRMIPSCWTVSALKKYLQNCVPQPESRAIPEKCLNKKICSCSTNSKTYPCNDSGCDALYLLCPNSK